MASKSKKRRRVFRASCILAALIIAGSSFAWFTSKDEVTNRLSANADYDVSIVESYAPPKNFLPGQKVNKDVYATNTGSIGAFVEESITTKLAIIKEVDTTTTFNEEEPNPTLAGDAVATKYSTGVIASTNGVKVGNDNVNIADCVALTKDEYYSVEAGSYLAFAPKGSSAKLGDIIVRYPDASEDLYASKADYKTVITKEAYDALADKTTYVKINEKMYKLREGTAILDEAGYKALTPDTEKAKYIEISYKSDFTPDTEGLYVFRRTIDTKSMTYGEEFFTYAGYYFKDGKYYKVKNIVVTPDDDIDMVFDENDKDGQLTSATANLVYEVKETVTPKLSYDLEKNRLVATYKGAGKDRSKVEGKEEALDEAEHELSVARAQLQRALQDQETSNANVAKYRNSAARLNAELEDTQARIAELEALIGYQAGSGTNTGSGDSTSPNKTGIEKQIENETTAKGNAKTNAEAALKLLYGTTVANYQISDDGTPGAAAYDTFPADADINDTAVEDAGTTYGNGAYYTKLLDAKNKLKKLKAEYGADMFSAYVNEIKNHTFNPPVDLSAITTFDELVASNLLKWSDLDDVSFDQSSVFNGTTVNKEHLHAINTLTWELKKAQEDYDNAMETAKSEIERYKKAKANIGTAGTIGDANPATGTIATVDVANNQSYDIKASTGGSGLEKTKSELKAELATAKNKEAALQAAITAELNNAVTATTVDGTVGTAAKELKDSQDNYNAKYRAYKKALDEYNNAKTAYDNGGDLKIYINLSDDVVTYGGVADKWQMLPVPAKGDNEPYYKFANDTAVFYWTGILQPGETSKKLIDSVELDKDTTQNMFKAFDFDLDVALKSAQVTYDEAGNALATAVNKDGTFTGELDADVAITDPANEKTTALTWTSKT